MPTAQYTPRSLFRLFIGGVTLALLAVLVSCGGGGDSGQAAPGPTMVVTYINSAGTQVPSTSIGSGYYAQARLRSADGLPLAGQTVRFTADWAYVAFIPDTIATALNTTGGTYTIASAFATTDANGIAQVRVRAKSLGTTYVKAEATVNGTALTQFSNPQIAAVEGGGGYPTGRATQSRIAIIPSYFSVEAFGIDNVATTLTVQLMDRQGGNVLAGTTVYWVSAYGTIDRTCTVDATSSCKVTIRSGGTRPSNGIVPVLAYLEGEEAFVDANNNGTYDSGEKFTDIGQPYLDTNVSWWYNPGVDQAIPGVGVGSVACDGSELSIINTCDGIWSNSVLVRQRINIIWATSTALITKVSRTSTATATSMLISATDTNGNVMGAGSTVTAIVSDTALACKVTTVDAYTDPKGLLITGYTINTNGDASCATAEFTVTVTSLAGIKSVARLL